MFRGCRRSSNLILMKLIEYIKRAFYNIREYFYKIDLIEEMSNISGLLLEKDKIIGDLNTNTGECFKECSVKKGTYIGSKECINCNYCYSCNIRILTTNSETIKSYSLIKCSVSRGKLYNFFIKYIIRYYKKLTHTLITYNVISLY